MYIQRQLYYGQTQKKKTDFLLSDTKSIFYFFIFFKWSTGNGTYIFIPCDANGALILDRFGPFSDRQTGTRSEKNTGSEIEKTFKLKIKLEPLPEPLF